MQEEAAGGKLPPLERKLRQQTGAEKQYYQTARQIYQKHSETVALSEPVI